MTSRPSPSPESGVATDTEPTPKVLATPASGERHVEIERKFDVPVEAVLPSAETIAAQLAEVAHVHTADPAHLEAVYLDTDQLDLIGQRIAIRRRTGGSDAGWHVKTSGAHGRFEQHWPIDPQHPDRLPDGLVDAVRQWADPATLGPVATIRTRRVTTELHDATGQRLVEIADDIVTAEDVRDGTIRQWREWETELDERLDDAPGSLGRRLLDALQAVLQEAGASPSTAVAKLQRALGLDPGDATRTSHPAADSLRTAESVPADLAASAASALDAATAISHVLTALSNRLDAHVRDALADRTDSVHQARILTRRLRSQLDVFGGLFDPAAVSLANHRLRRLGRDLGAARDAEVRAKYAEDHLRQLHDVPGARRLVGRLAEPAWQAYAQQHEQLSTRLRPRHLERVQAALAIVSVAESASAFGQKDATRTIRIQLAELVGRLVSHDHVAVAIWSALPATGGRQRDLDAFERALHEVRKDARRLRYAVEAISTELADAPVHIFDADPAHELAAAAKALQDLLGDARDDALFASYVLAVAADDGKARRSGAHARPYYLLADQARGRASDALGRYAAVRDELLTQAAAVGLTARV